MPVKCLWLPGDMPQSRNSLKNTSATAKIAACSALNTQLLCNLTQQLRRVKVKLSYTEKGFVHYACTDTSNEESPSSYSQHTYMLI